jgi:hypothetical protein
LADRLLLSLLLFLFLPLLLVLHVARRPWLMRRVRGRRDATAASSDASCVARHGEGGRREKEQEKRVKKE